MKIRTLRNVLIKGKHYKIGATVEVDAKTGKYLIAIKKAAKVEPKRKETAASKEAQERETR